MTINSTILEQLGITSNAARVYLALFQNGTSSATELSTRSGVPRGIIYRVLDELLSLGLCVLKSGTVKQYAVTDPDLNLRGLIEAKRQKVVAAEALHEELRDSYKRILTQEQGPLEYIEILKDPKLINAKYIELINNTREEALTFIKWPIIGQKVNAVSDQIQSQRELLKKKIRLRSLYELDRFYELDTLNDYKDKETRSYIRLLQSLHFSHANGIKDIRIAESLPLKAGIFDARDLLLLLPDPITQTFSVTTLHIRHSHLAAGLKMLFESIWQNSISWEEFLERNNAKSSYNVKLEDL